MNLRIRLALAAVALLMPSSAPAEDLYRHDGWAAMASDRRAAAVGDTLTVIVYENASAANSVQSGSRRDTQLNGGLSVGSALNESGGLSLRGSASNNGQTGRSGRMVAQLSVTVEEVRPNGDLVIAGAQNLNINRERTFIRLRGRVRSADISSANTIVSSRISDAQIDYNGSGFASRSGRPGLVQRFFGFLGLM